MSIFLKTLTINRTSSGKWEVLRAQKEFVRLHCNIILWSNFLQCWILLVEELFEDGVNWLQDWLGRNMVCVCLVPPDNIFWELWANLIDWLYHLTAYFENFVPIWLIDWLIVPPDNKFWDLTTFFLRTLCQFDWLIDWLYHLTT